MTPLDAFGARRRQLLTGSGAIALGGLLGTPALWAQTGAVTYEPERGVGSNPRCAARSATAARPSSLSRICLPMPLSQPA